MTIEKRWTDQQRQLVVVLVTRAWAEIRNEVEFLHNAHELVAIIDLLCGTDTVIISQMTGTAKPPEHVREELIQQMFDLFFAPGRLGDDARPSSFHRFASPNELDEFLQEDARQQALFHHPDD